MNYTVTEPDDNVTESSNRLLCDIARIHAEQERVYSVLRRLCEQTAVYNVVADKALITLSSDMTGLRTDTKNAVNNMADELLLLRTNTKNAMDKMSGELASLHARADRFERSGAEIITKVAPVANEALALVNFGVLTSIAGTIICTLCAAIPLFMKKI